MRLLRSWITINAFSAIFRLGFIPMVIYLAFCLGPDYFDDGVIEGQTPIQYPIDLAEKGSL